MKCIHSLAIVPVTLACVALTGCAIESTVPAAPASGATILGVVHGGQQPVSGSHIYLYAAGVSGYGGGATSLLTASTSSPPTAGATTKDAYGNYYVTSDASGSFSITGDYTCTPDSNGVPGQQVYLYAVGGNSGSGTNAAVGLMAVLGDCPSAGTFAAATPNVTVNEVSTVAAAYAMAGFAYSSSTVSSSGTTLAKIGIANAFANAANLATLSTGTALATTPAGNGTAPQATVNTLANILAACVNSAGAVTGPTNPTACYTLFYNAKSGGSTGGVPTDTATAAINIAHNPGSNIATLYGLPVASAPFGPALTSQPNDFTLLILFLSGSGLYSPTSLAVDSSGDVWAACSTFYDVAELSSLGVVISPASGFPLTVGEQSEGIAISNAGYVWVGDSSNPGTISYFSETAPPTSRSLSGNTSGGIAQPMSVAVDANYNAWYGDYQGGISKFAPPGVSLSSGSGPFVEQGVGGVGYPTSIAIDGSGNAWTANALGNVSKVSPSGVGLSPYTGFIVGQAATKASIAMDSTGHAWVANSGTSTATGALFKLANSGLLLSPSGYTGGGLTGPTGIALDGAGNIWISNNNSTGIMPGVVAEFSSSGVALSPSTGYTPYAAVNTITNAIAIDGSGDVWTAGAHSLSELIGAATPVITPLSAGLPSLATSDGSSNLGTKP